MRNYSTRLMKTLLLAQRVKGEVQKVQFQSLLLATDLALPLLSFSHYQPATHSDSIHSSFGSTNLAAVMSPLVRPIDNKRGSLFQILTNHYFLGLAAVVAHFGPSQCQFLQSSWQRVVCWSLSAFWVDHPRVTLFAVPSIQLGHIRSTHSWTVGKKLSLPSFYLRKQLTFIEPPGPAAIIFLRKATYRPCIPRFVHRLQYLVRRSIHLRLPPNLSYIGWIGRWSSGGSWADHRR